MSGFFALRIRPWGVVTAAAALAGAGTIAGFLGRFAWWLELASHFRVQYFLLLALMAIVLAILRKPAAAGLCAGLAAVNFALIVPLYLGGPPPPPGAATRYRAMLVNVNKQTSGNENRVLAAVRNHDPDFILFEEVDERWADRLKELWPAYPYRTVDVRDDCFGIALLSKVPFEKSKIANVGHVGVPSVYGVLKADGTSFTLVGTHPLPPGSAEYAHYRNQQLDELPSFLARFKGPLILLGDLNASPWSPYFRKLIRATGLRDSSRGRGVQPTWPAFAWPMLIPIDHCLHNDGIVILEKEVGEDIGSDHLPVIVDFAVGRGQGTPNAQRRTTNVEVL